MPKTVVHIGPHKTGTTAVQAFIGQEKDRLLGDGVKVIDDEYWGGRAGQAHIVTNIIREGVSSDWYAELARIVKEAQDKKLTILLSSEVFFRHLCTAVSRNGYSPILANLQQLTGGSIYFILVIRAFGEYINSLVAENILATPVSDGFPMIAQRIERFLQIEGVIQNLENSVGESSVKVFSYEEACRGSGVVSEVLAAAGVGMSIQKHYEMIGRSRDARGLHAMLPARLLALKYRLNQLGLPNQVYAALRWQLPKLAMGYEREKFRLFTAKDMKGLIRRTESFNRGLNERLGINKKRLYGENINRHTYCDLEGYAIEDLWPELVELYEINILKGTERIKKIESNDS